MTRDVLLRVVKAARLSVRLAESTKELLVNKRCQTVADEIAGLLTDALFYSSGEKLVVGQDFMDDSKTMNLLMSDMSDGDVADEFISMSQMPGPALMSSEEFKNMCMRNGGYMAGSGK